MWLFFRLEYRHFEPYDRMVPGYPANHIMRIDEHIGSRHFHNPQNVATNNPNQGGENIEASVATSNQLCHNYRIN